MKDERKVTARQVFPALHMVYMCYVHNYVATTLQGRQKNFEEWLNSVGVVKESEVYRKLHVFASTGESTHQPTDEAIRECLGVLAIELATPADESLEKVSSEHWGPGRYPTIAALYEIYEVERKWIASAGTRWELLKKVEVELSTPPIYW